MRSDLVPFIKQRKRLNFYPRMFSMTTFRESWYEPCIILEVFILVYVLHDRHHYHHPIKVVY